MSLKLPLQSYVRAVLLRADASIDPIQVDGFLDSEELQKLTRLFETKLLQYFDIARRNGSKPPDGPVASNKAPELPAEVAAEVKPVFFTALQADTPLGLAPDPVSADAPKPSAEAPKAAPDMPPIVRPIGFRLQNGRAGEVYRQKLMPEPGDAPALVYVDILVPAELGLTADPASGELSGTPKVAGEFEIGVIYHLATNDPSRRQKGSVKLLVNPDPKSLWLDLPSDSSAPYWKEDASSQVVIGRDFHIIAASKRGRSHGHVGSFRDDDYLIRHLPHSNWYLSIVADGAGSAKYSRRGSLLACREAGSHLQKTLDGPEGQAVAAAAEAYHQARSDPTNAARLAATRQTLHNSLYVTVGHAAYHAVKAIHDEQGARHDLNAVYKDFSTTALIAVCHRFPFGVLCAAYWVGDGAVGMYRQGQGITLLGSVDSGDFSGQTRFLDAGEVTQEALLRRTRFELVDDLTSLVLMTDGVSDPKFETDARLAHLTAWDELWLDLDQSVGLTAKEDGLEQRLLSWLDFWSPGNHDDRTIAIIF